MILNQIIQDNHSIKENHNDVDNDFSSRIFNDNDNEMILKRALRRIENALKQIDNNNSNDDQLMVVDKQQSSSSISHFDHNNNPNP
ncbi:hypothetical protein DERP_002491 [Dermatophagoides pteronyssinus]|uniref:Uncharacterized protein n=1 Tax=Dermatophagoides pteronyssinus TaxID=6956 RepID=A0ABQ8JHW2_DERPT|nr:hypothetical protein DERP_002491 [Dermatophagoides pteronyssinus]